METKPYKAALFVLLAGILLAGCTNSVAYPPTSTPTAASGDVAQSTLSTATPVPAVPAGVGHLYVIVSAGSQPSQKYQADVYVFSNDQLVAKGTTEKGIYMAQIDSGVYDIAMVYSGQPLFGQVQRGVLIEPDKQNLVTFVLPPEGSLTITILMKNGKQALRPVYVTIAAEDREIFKDLSSSSPFVLRTGYTYSVTVKYGSNKEPVMTFTDEVKIAPEQVDEKFFTLPYDETSLKLEAKAGTEAAYGFNVVVTDTDTGNTVYKGSYSYTSGIILEAEKKYLVQITYKGSTQEKTITAGGNEVLLQFAFP